MRSVYCIFFLVLALSSASAHESTKPKLTMRKASARRDQAVTGPVDPQTVPLISVDAAVVGPPNASQPNSTAESPVESTPVVWADDDVPAEDKPVMIPASSMHCSVIKNDEGGMLNSKEPKWLLVCQDIAIDKVYFYDRDDCTLIDGVRECSLELNRQRFA